MKLLLSFLLFCAALSAEYVDGTPLYLDPGANTAIITNTGIAGGTFNMLVLDYDARQQRCMTRLCGLTSCQNVVWFSMPGFPQQVGSLTACHATCGVSLNHEYGQYKYWLEICISSRGVPTWDLQVSLGQELFTFRPESLCGVKSRHISNPDPCHGIRELLLLDSVCDCRGN